MGTMISICAFVSFVSPNCGPMQDGRETHFGRQLEHIRFDSSQDKRLDHLVKLCHLGFVEVFKPGFEIGEIPMVE